MKDTPGFVVRRTDEHDAPHVFSLVNELMPNEAVVARARWLEGALPRSATARWIAIDDATGAPMGTTAFFRRRMIAGGKPLDGALGGDMWVRPEYRRRGVGKALFLAARRDMPSLGFEVMFGTPRKANETPLSSSGSTLAAAVQRWARPLMVPRLGVPLSIPPPGMRLDPVTGHDSRVDVLWAETARELDLATVRDGAFYSWRFVGSPSKRQLAYVVCDGEQPVAACALERLDQRMRIVDLVAPAARWPRALNAIAAFAKGCDLLEIKLAHSDGRRRGLWKSGFLPREVKPMSVLTVDDHARRDLHDGDRWFFTLADTDMDHG